MWHLLPLAANFYMTVTVQYLYSYDSFIIKYSRKSGMYFLVHRMVYVVYLTYYDTRVKSSEI